MTRKRRKVTPKPPPPFGSGIYAVADRRRDASDNASDAPADLEHDRRDRNLGISETFHRLAVTRPERKQNRLDELIHD
jgi:hypothetical protein